MKKKTKKVSYYAADGLTMYDPNTQLMQNQFVSPDAVNTGTVLPYQQEASFAAGLQTTAGQSAAELNRKKNRSLQEKIGGFLGGETGEKIGSVTNKVTTTANSLRKIIGKALLPGGGLMEYGGKMCEDGGYLNTGEMQYLPVNNEFNPQQIQPIDPNTKVKRDINWQQLGMDTADLAGNILKNINIPVGNAITGTLAAANALTNSEKGRTSYRKLRTGTNPYPYGDGSQALYENGGYITRKRKQGNIQITEELPDFAEPIPDNYLSNRQFPVQVDRPQFQPIQPNFPKSQTYDTTYNMFGEDPQYIPNYTGFNYREALQSLQEEPDFIGDIPVVKSPDIYSEMTSGFVPNSESFQWQPYSDEDQMGYFENGGKIHIKPENKGKFTASANRAGMGVQAYASKVLADPSASPLLRKRANFAKNATKFNHKNGGIVEGSSYDMTNEEIEQLISAGYQISFD